MAKERTRDVVVIGGSAGALAPLRELVRALPEDLAASLYVVIHGPAAGRSHLREILARETALPVVEAVDDAAPERGRIYVAAPDAHLLLGADHIHLRRGPSENGFRPAIDPLFRSAAVSASTRVIGVVLSGTLDDGASGLRAVKRCGGLTVIQEPSDADYPDMPEAADAAAGADYRLPAAGLGQLLAELVGQAAPPAREADEDIRLEVLIAGLEEATMASEHELGRLSPFSCPDCNGNLWQIEDGALIRFRCHTGHGYTAETLADLQETVLERRLYEVLRGQREKAALLRQMAERSGPRTSEAFLRRAALYEEDATLVEQVLRNGHTPAAAGFARKPSMGADIRRETEAQH